MSADDGFSSISCLILYLDRHERMTEREVLMKKQKIMLMLLTILAFCMVMTGTAGAQDIDIDNMDNEQLLILLQQIMDKLEQQETAEVTEVPTAETAVPEAAEPVIELKKTEGYTPTWMTGYAEEGYTAFDAVDGDLTDKVESVRLGDRIRYSVTDSEGNSTSVERVLVTQNFAPPEITVLGEPVMTMQAGLWFQDPGA
ncbi:MAG: hypothetical protein IKP86_02475, partial [Anaerolineaceae bacterium]|nr:hypothetical protein [Anaerolineaceae bacterium]